MLSTHGYPAVHGNLLVVEDDADFAPLLKEVLVMAGYDVQLARSVAEAKAGIAAAPVVAAILDWSLLGGSAHEIADLLKRARVPYVFASGANPTDLPSGHRWAPFFAKPFPITALINAVEQARSTGVPAEA